MGDIAPDGDVSTSFAPLGVTYKDSAIFEQSEEEDIEHGCEEFDDPAEVVSGSKKTTLNWELLDFSPETLVKVLGGAVKGNKWEGPAVTSDVIEKSIKIIPKKGGEIVIPRAKIKGRIVYNVARTGIARVAITAKVLTPTKAGTPPITIG